MSLSYEAAVVEMNTALENIISTSLSNFMFFKTDQVIPEPKPEKFVKAKIQHLVGEPGGVGEGVLYDRSGLLMAIVQATSESEGYGAADKITRGLEKYRSVNGLWFREVRVSEGSQLAEIVRNSPGGIGTDTIFGRSMFEVIAGFEYYLVPP